MPQADGDSDIIALRVLLIADLLARTAELRGLQALIALHVTGAAPMQATALKSGASALGIHPPAVYTASDDAQSSLGGPVDVHLVSQGTGSDPGKDGLFVCVGAARLYIADNPTRDAAGRLLAAHGQDPLAARLALMSFPSHRPAELTDDKLTGAWETLAEWRLRVAGWAESPSQPIPARIAEMVRVAFGDLDTVSVLALLCDLAANANVSAGAKFETFVYADRILGLDLAREVGR